MNNPITSNDLEKDYEAKINEKSSICPKNSVSEEFNMDSIRNGWFSEISEEMWPGQCFSLQIEKILYKDKSPFQDILIVQTTNHGRALILDGVIQCTESDEFAYQEMISFLPLCSHPNPEKVLIVGGGDGGVAREVDKHPAVKQFTQVEIDGKVVEACKQHLPFMAVGYDSPKLTLKIGDGFQHMVDHKEEFDVIITDCSDPVGPAENLYTESYFERLKNALRKGGLISMQIGSFWTNIDSTIQSINHCKKYFKTVKLATAMVPTYPNGQISFLVAALDDKDFTVPQSHLQEDVLSRLNYYNTENHSAAFALPNFIKKHCQ